MSFSDTERNALAELLLVKGPDAPTLCGQWSTHDLAAHLWVREQQPMASIKSLLPNMSGALEEETRIALERPYDELVRKWQQGPTGLNPWRVLDPLANSLEHFIHHEDVRRGALSAGDAVTVRELPDGHERQLYRMLKLFAPRALSSDRPVIVKPHGKPRIVVNDKPGVAENGQMVVRIDGAVGELVLWMFGRDVVQLDFSGDDSSVTRMSL